MITELLTLINKYEQARNAARVIFETGGGKTAFTFAQNAVQHAQLNLCDYLVIHKDELANWSGMSNGTERI